MARFTEDNTEGYSASDLADLNAAFNVRMSELACQGVDTENGSLQDNVAERLLAELDATRAA